MANLTTIELYKQQFPLSTDIGAVNPEDSQITDYIELASATIQEYLQRDLENKLRSEWHNTYDDNIVIMNQYPINQVYGVLAGKELWAQLQLTESDDIVSMNFYNDSVNDATIDIVINMEDALTPITVTDSTDIDDLLSTIQSVLAAEGITSTYTTNTSYSSQKLTGLQALSQTQGNFNSIFEFYGIDKNSTISWTKEDERNIILSNRIRTGSNTVLIRYTAGYTLPAVLDYGTLPRPIIDATNRIVNDSLNNDLNDGSDDMKYKSEKLGNATYANWDYDESNNNTYIQGLVNRYANQLDPYRRKDVAFY